MAAINEVRMADIASFSGGMAQYQFLATRTAIYPGQGSALGLAYVALKMNGEAGEFAEHVGKAMRDDGLILTRQIDGDREAHLFGFVSDLYPGVGLDPDRREKLIKEIGDVLWYLSAACNELGITLEEVAMANLVKLANRTQKGTLQGSGDDR